MHKFRRMYIYKETHLPTEGWLQGCFVCYSITGNCEVFNKSETVSHITERVVFLCTRCCRIIAGDDTLKNNYEEKVRGYIQRATI